MRNHHSLTIHLPAADSARLVTITLTAAAPNDPRARIQWHRDVCPLVEGHVPDDFITVPVERDAAYELVCDGKARACPAWRQSPVGPCRTVVVTAMMTARHLEQIGLTMFSHTAHEDSQPDFFSLPFVAGSGFTITVEGELVADEPAKRSATVEEQRMKSGKSARLAILTATIVGRFTTWKKGQHVLVTPLNGASRYSIERLRWKGVLPLQNQCCGVPRSALRFLP